MQNYLSVHLTSWHYIFQNKFRHNPRLVVHGKFHPQATP